MAPTRRCLWPGPDAAITWEQVPLRALPVDTPDADVILVLPPGTVGHRNAGFMGW